MRFEDHVTKTIIPEWKHYYINYSVPNELLKTLKALRMRVNFKFGHYQINNLSDEERGFVTNVGDHFKQVLKDQIAKFEDFLVYKIEMSLKPMLIKIIYNLKNIKGKHFPKPEIKEIKHQLREEVKNFYKDINLVKQYLNLNLKIFCKLTKKYKRIFSAINMLDKDILVAVNESMKRVNIPKLHKVLERYSKTVETLYVEQFFKEKQYKEAYDELSKVTSNDQFTKQESFAFGIYLGAFLVCAILCALLLAETNFFAAQQSEFVIYQFPLFRGTLVLSFYIFLLGVDVYVWEQFNINYKNVFNLGYNTSSAFQIMKRAFGFLMVWILIFSYCALSNSEYFDQAVFFDKAASAYIAPLVWSTFFVYLFFPSRRMLNYEGRKYVFKVMKNVICAPFKKNTLSTDLEIDQLLSFAVVSKDLLYALCYIDNVVDIGIAKNQCSGRTYDIIEMSVVMVILLWSFLPYVGQLIRNEREKLSISETEYTEIRNKCVHEIGRGLVSLTTIITSYYISEYWYMLFYWIAATIVTTFSSFYCDLVDDWGFLQSNNFLREKLSYPNKFYYYVAIIANFFLRLSWTLNLSNSLLSTPLARSCVALLSSLLECVRRMIWNFFKVEFEHLKLEGNFNAVRNYDLPFDFEIDMSKPEIANAVHIQVNYYLKKSFMSNSNELNLTDSDVIEKMMGEIIDNNPSSRRITNVTVRRQSNFKFVDEDKLKVDLYEYNKSLQHCLQFIAFVKQSNIGTAVTTIRPDLLVVTSSIMKSRRLSDHTQRDSLNKTVLGNFPNLNKTLVGESEIHLAHTDQPFKKPLFTKENSAR